MDFHKLIHQQREKLLRIIPKGAQRVLSAGCDKKWYFKWFEECYGPVKEHIGVELYNPKPNDLPSNVKWISKSVDDLSDVASGSCDLVFSGQNIEHITPFTLLGFIKESHRVLKSDGYLVIDSPNRSTTAPMRYRHPEHLLEFTRENIQAILLAAGFDITHFYSISGSDKIDDNFIWWVVATKTRKLDEQKLFQIIEELFLCDFPGFVRCKFLKQIGQLHEAYGSEATIKILPNETGYLLYGPFIPLFKGTYQVGFDFKLNTEKSLKEGFINFDVASSGGEIIHAKETIHIDPKYNQWSHFSFEVTIDDYMPGIEIRAFSSGCHGLFRFGATILKIA